jgi:hypothetical protein
MVFQLTHETNVNWLKEFVKCYFEVNFFKKCFVDLQKEYNQTLLTCLSSI